MDAEQQQAQAARPTVWVVYEEWERAGDGGHACIASAHTTKESAENAQEKLIVELLADNFQVWGWEWDDEDETLWDVDVHVEAVEVFDGR